MFTAKEYALPATLDEAYKILTARNTNCIVGGCAWLQMGKRRMNTAVDLSMIGLDFIREDEESITIGAMTSYRSVELSPVLNQYFNGMLGKAVAPIIGTQFRNSVTVGGSVYARFGFSDFLTPLLALDTEVELYREGRVSLAEFMTMPYKKDILVKIIIKKDQRQLSYQMLRNAEADFPIVNLAVSKIGASLRVTVGARPMKVVIAKQTSEYLSACDGMLTEQMVEVAAKILATEVEFKSNMRASAEYRLKIARVLFVRALKEVGAC